MGTKQFSLAKVLALVCLAMISPTIAAIILAFWVVKAAYEMGLNNNNKQ